MKKWIAYLILFFFLLFMVGKNCAVNINPDYKSLSKRIEFKMVKQNTNNSTISLLNDNPDDTQISVDTSDEDDFSSSEISLIPVFILSTLGIIYFFAFHRQRSTIYNGISKKHIATAIFILIQTFRI